MDKFFWHKGRAYLRKDLISGLDILLEMREKGQTGEVPLSSFCQVCSESPQLLCPHCQTRSQAASVLRRLKATSH
jgi:hypothetical protein